MQIALSVFPPYASSVLYSSELRFGVINTLIQLLLQSIKLVERLLWYSWSTFTETFQRQAVEIVFVTFLCVVDKLIVGVKTNTVLYAVYYFFHVHGYIRFVIIYTADLTDPPSASRMKLPEIEKRVNVFTTRFLIILS